MSVDDLAGRIGRHAELRQRRIDFDGTLADDEHREIRLDRRIEPATHLVQVTQEQAFAAAIHDVEPRIEPLGHGRKVALAGNLQRGRIRVADDEHAALAVLRCHFLVVEPERVEGEACVALLCLEHLAVGQVAVTDLRIELLRRRTADQQPAQDLAAEQDHQHAQEDPTRGTPARSRARGGRGLQRRVPFGVAFDRLWCVHPSTQPFTCLCWPASAGATAKAARSARLPRRPAASQGPAPATRARSGQRWTAPAASTCLRAPAR